MPVECRPHSMMSLLRARTVPLTGCTVGGLVPTCP